MYIHDFQIAFEDILGRLYTNWPVLHNSSSFFMYNMYTIFLSMSCIHFRHYSALHYMFSKSLFKVRCKKHFMSILSDS